MRIPHSYIVNVQPFTKGLLITNIALKETSEIISLTFFYNFIGFDAIRNTTMSRYYQ